MAQQMETSDASVDRSRFTCNTTPVGANCTDLCIKQSHMIHVIIGMIKPNICNGSHV